MNLNFKHNVFFLSCYACYLIWTSLPQVLIFLTCSIVFKSRKITLSFPLQVRQSNKIARWHRSFVIGWCSKRSSFIFKDLCWWKTFVWSCNRYTSPLWNLEFTSNVTIQISLQSLLSLVQTIISRTGLLFTPWWCNE